MLANFVWFDAQHHVASVGDYMIDHMKKALKIKTHRKKSRPSPKIRFHAQFVQSYGEQITTVWTYLSYTRFVWVWGNKKEYATAIE